MTDDATSVASTSTPLVPWAWAFCGAGVFLGLFAHRLRVESALRRRLATQS